MRASGLGVVISTGDNSKFKTGDYVTGSWGIKVYFVHTDLKTETLFCTLGMTEYAIVQDKHLDKIEWAIAPLEFPASTQRVVDFIQALSLSTTSIHSASLVSQHISDSRGSANLNQGKSLLFRAQPDLLVTPRVSSVKQQGQRSMGSPVHKTSAMFWRKRSA